MPVNISDNAVRVYSAYRRATAGAGGVYNKPIFADLKHWEKIASICDKIHATPDRFIATQFVVLDDYRRRLMTPSGLYKPINRAIEVYEMFSPSLVDYDKLFKMLEINFTAAGETVEVLENPFMTFPAWFRVVKAEPMTSKIKNRYLQNACEEVEADYGLRVFLKKEKLYARFERPAV